MSVLNYANLEPKEFESLAKDVMEKILGIPMERFGDGKDGGVDLTEELGERKIIVQCKRYLETGSTEAVRRLKNEHTKVQVMNPQPEKYYIFTTVSLLPQQVIDLRETFSAYMESDANIIYREKIEDFFNEPENADVLRKHLGLVDSRPEWFKGSETSCIKSNLPYLESNFTRNHDVVIGREEKLAQIHQSLVQQGDTSASRIVFISGIGGIGKSVLAKKYAEIHKDEYDIQLEVSADSFRSVITAIPLQNWEEAGTDEENKYQNKLLLLIDLMEKQRVLLIVHGYNTVADPEQRWGKLPCDTLITTWNEWKNFGNEIRLREADINEYNAVAIFSHYYLSGSGPDLQDELRQYLTNESETVKKIVKSVGYHPLAIKVLAKQMVCEGNDIITPERMLQQLSFSHEKEFTYIHESGDKSKQEKASAYKHLEKEFLTGFENGRLTTDQLEALRFMTLTSPICGISSSRFADWTGLNKKLPEDLYKHGWIEYERKRTDYLDEQSDNTGIYRMPMVISSILYQIDSLQSTTEKSASFIDNCLQMDINKCSTYEKKYALEQQCVILTDHIQEAENAQMGSLYNMTGCALCDHSPSVKRLGYFEKSLDIRKKVLGENNADTAKSYGNVGYTYVQTGELEKALEYLEKALEIHRRVLGENNADTAWDYDDLGRAYEEMGAYKKGFKYQKKALNIRRKVLGENNVETARSYDHVGFYYAAHDEKKIGLQYQEKALEIRRSVLGENHQDTAASYNNIGVSYYWFLSDYVRAYEYYDKAYNIYMNIYGKENSMTKQAENNREDAKKGLKNAKAGSFQSVSEWIHDRIDQLFSLK